ncbi:hypothetical protein Lfu02_25250 [Longispora fulva]|uniref:Uncharacterized protein n=1 Tax=Longispora fulva TaxID=619741 RepID=A0A8J7GHV3_9ACTN|nr:hypothetical protein [Longispora fulva]MBG6139464.1 hypothetical protein [Longispora fulva]GIG58153.1 hypothetical protein Lfu02_25250 [Longispora fulva]
MLAKIAFSVGGTVATGVVLGRVVKAETDTVFLVMGFVLVTLVGLAEMIRPSRFSDS